MNIIYLRGSIPDNYDRMAKYYYDSIGDCEDMWTQLFCLLTKQLGGQGEMLYQYNQKRRTHEAKGYFTEQWVPNFRDYDPPFKPDLIVCRGGFDYYDDFVCRFPKARKVYYGAGARFYPQSAFRDYHLFLVDSHKQLAKVRAKASKAKVDLLLKPAATLFAPVNVAKDYDVAFVANASEALIKRHELFLRSFQGTGYRILNIGTVDQKWVELARELMVDVTWSGWHLRKELPGLLSRCNIGVCCCGDRDSCPRVIPEYLACGLPIIVTDNVHFWHDKYVTQETGFVVQDDQLVEGVHTIIAERAAYDPAGYYERNLSMPVAAKRLKKQIQSIL